MDRFTARFEVRLPDGTDLWALGEESTGALLTVFEWEDFPPDWLVNIAASTADGKSATRRSLTAVESDFRVHRLRPQHLSIYVGRTLRDAPPSSVSLNLIALPLKGVVIVKVQGAVVGNSRVPVELFRTNLVSEMAQRFERFPGAVFETLTTNIYSDLESNLLSIPYEESAGRSTSKIDAVEDASISTREQVRPDAPRSDNVSRQGARDSLPLMSPDALPKPEEAQSISRVRTWLGETINKVIVGVVTAVLVAILLAGLKAAGILAP